MAGLVLDSTGRTTENDIIWGPKYPRPNPPPGGIQVTPSYQASLLGGGTPYPGNTPVHGRVDILTGQPVKTPSKKVYDANGNLIDLPSGVTPQRGGPVYTTPPPPDNSQRDAAIKALQDSNQYQYIPSVGVESGGKVAQATYDQGYLTQLAAKNAQAQAEAGQKAQADSMKALAAQQADAEMKLLAERARLTDTSFNNRFSQLSGMGNSPGQVQHGTSLAGNEEAARAAAFARAKEMAGNNANAALKALKGHFENQGTMGSTQAAGAAGQVIGNAGAGVNQFLRDQLISDLSRAADIADLEYQGGITQRGQDMNLQQALMALLSSGPVY